MDAITAPPRLEPEHLNSSLVAGCSRGCKPLTPYLLKASGDSSSIFMCCMSRRIWIFPPISGLIRLLYIVKYILYLLQIRCQNFLEDLTSLRSGVVNASVTFKTHIISSLTVMLCYLNLLNADVNWDVNWTISNIFLFKFKNLIPRIVQPWDIQNGTNKISDDRLLLIHNIENVNYIDMVDG